MGLFSGNKKNKVTDLPKDFEPMHTSIFEKVKPFTLTSAERVFGLIEAVKYIHQFKIEGSIVECGVWKGGSMLAIADTLVAVNDTGRSLYLYDTFEGMSSPTEDDIDVDNRDAADLLKKEKKDTSVIWAYSTIDEVKQTIGKSSYDQNQFHYIKGKVEDTIPQQSPEKIALLRLDTDWYESTRHELTHLFPLLVKGGILIIDDYGFWKGARKAVDEYFSENNIQILLGRMDDTGRIAVKQ